MDDAPTVAIFGTLTRGEGLPRCDGIIKLRDGRQLYVDADGKALAAMPFECMNTDNMRRVWTVTDGIARLDDGRQLQVDLDGWAFAEVPGEGMNVDDARRVWMA